MSYITFTDRLDAEAYELECREALGIPNNTHRHVGGGRHVTVHPTEPGPGWTLAYATVREHPTERRFAVPALAPEHVPPSRRPSIEASWSRRETLDETWTPEPTAP